VKVTPEHPITEKQIAANGRNARLPRRIRLTRDMLPKLDEAIRAGVRPVVAAALCGIPSRTFEDWMQKARAENARPILVELRETVELALAQWEAADVLQIGSAARKKSDGEWQAAAWRLERRLPSVYGRKTKVEQDVTVTARPFIDTTKLTVPQRELLLDLLKLAAPDSPEELPADAKPALELMPGDTAAA